MQRPLALLHFDYNQMREFEQKITEIVVERVPLKGNSLYLLKPLNPLRVFCANLTVHKYFERIVICFIIFSTLTLAFEEPMMDPNGDMMRIVTLLDQIMTGLFTLEALLKIIALGFLFNGGNSYLRNSWNVLDFLIVIFALFSQVLDANISFIKVLRVARILRPLRLIQRAQGLKIAIQSLFNSLPDIFRLQVVVFFVMFMISILLTTLLSGKLSYCDLSFTTLTEQQAATHVSNMW